MSNPRADDKKDHKESEKQQYYFYIIKTPLEKLFPTDPQQYSYTLSSTPIEACKIKEATDWGKDHFGNENSQAWAEKIYLTLEEFSQARGQDTQMAKESLDELLKKNNERKVLLEIAKTKRDAHLLIQGMRDSKSPFSKLSTDTVRTILSYSAGRTKEQAGNIVEDIGEKSKIKRNSK